MKWKTKWGCPCGAIWASETDEQPEHRMCYPGCPKPELTKLPDEPILFRSLEKEE